MVRGNMMRWACAVASSAMILAGCNCPGPNPPVDCTDTTISFETPTSGQTVDSPFEVSVNVKTSNGEAFAIDSAQITVSDGSAINGTVSGNRATFTGLTSGAGSQTLVATIARGTCSKNSSAQTITVRDVCSNAAVSAVSFPQDTGAPLGVLNRNELPPGTSLQVKVDASCVAGVQVRIKRGNTEVSPLTAFVNGTVTITLPSLPDSDNARYDLFAELVRGTTVVNTLAGNPQAGGSIQVSRALPSCAVGTPLRCLGPLDDADSATAGFQMRVTGTMAANSSGTIALAGQTPIAVAPNMTGDVSADFTLATSGSFIATITCVDATGNTNTATGTYCADFQPPVVTIVSPASVDGGATMAVTQSPLQVRVSTDAEDGSRAVASYNGMQVGTGVVANGMVTVPVPFGADGTFTITVVVTDLAGNDGQASINVTVALRGCGGVFSRPGACPALLTRSELPGGSYSFQTTSKPSCANQPASLFRADVLTDGGSAAEVPAGTTTLTGSGLASFPALTLASGEYVFRGQIVNAGVDAGVSTVSCRVTVDLEGPALTNPLGSPPVIINASQDTQPGTPGVQRVLSFSARVPVGGRVDVCTTQPLNPNAPLADGGFSTRPTSPECGAGWYVLQQGVTSPANGFTFPDGTYDVKIVVVGGGLAVAPSSTPVSVLVDSVRPCVNGITRDLPQDTNGDARLSLAELAGGQPRLVFGLGCGDVSAATLSATTPVVIRDVVGNAVRPSTAAFSNGAYTVTLTGTFAAEVDLNVFVELTDLAGNSNALAPMNDPSTFSFRVDPVVPVCNISAPTAALLGIAQVPGGNLDVLVATSADVGTNAVSISFTGEAVRNITPTLSQAQSTYALSGDNTYTIGATCTDQSGNSGVAAPRTVRVDLVAPTCNITSPANLAVSSVNDISTTVAVTGVTNSDVVAVTSSLAGIANNSLPVVGATATRVVRYPNGLQTVTASISDAAGNPCVAPSGGTRQIQLTVNSTSCNLDFVSGGAVITNANGSWVNRASAANPTGTSPATVTIGALTSDCGVGRNVYLYQGAPVTSPPGTPQVTNGTGAVSFAGTVVSEGQQWTVSINNGAGVFTHRSFLISFAVPTIASIGLQRSAAVTTVIPVAANASLTFGAAVGNRRVETATGTDLIFGDLDAATVDAQFQLTLTGIDGARVGTLNGELDVLEGAATLMPTVSVNAPSFTPSLPRMRLGHRVDETTTTLVIRVTSPAGNIFTSTHTAEVDVIAPTAPSVTQSLDSARAATVGLSWAPVFDDTTNLASGGLTGGTPPAGYDVRWTTSSVPLNNSMAAEADYFGSASNSDGITSWSVAPISKPLTLPPINTYFIGVRARDEVGNYSVYSAPTAVPNQPTITTLASALPTTSFGQTVQISASLNSDAVNDLIVSAPVAAGGGGVFVYFGGSGFANQTGCSTGCQTLTPSDTTAGQFGSDIGVGGNVGDIASEGRPDLVVGQILTAAAPNNGGRVTIYFGSLTATLDASQAIELRGDTTGRVGFTTRIIRDVNGDGLDEVAIAAPFWSGGGVTNQGRIYIFKGRPRAQWSAARTATDPTSMVPYIPISAMTADYVIDGPLNMGMTLSTGGNSFGQRRTGLGSVGDSLPNPDGGVGTINNLVIPMSRPAINSMRIYSGASIAASSGAAPLAGSAQVSEYTLAPVADTSFNNGLGVALTGSLDVLDSTSRDIVVTYPNVGRVHLLSSLVGATLNPVATVQGPGTFGFSVSGGAINADTAADLVVGQGATAGNSVWIIYQRTSGAPFENMSGSAAFFFSRLDGTVLVGQSTNRFGWYTAVGDLTGDGVAEVVIGDETTGVVKVLR